MKVERGVEFQKWCVEFNSPHFGLVASVRLIDPSLVEALADETGGKGVEGGEDVSAAFVADREGSEAAKLGERALEDLTAIPQPLLVIDTTAGDSGTEDRYRSALRQSARS